MESRNYSFVVRLWLESADNEKGHAIWRGSVEQVGSDCRFYFSDLDGITRFIQTQIGVKKSPALFGWRLSWEHLFNGIRKFWKRFLP